MATTVSAGGAGLASEFGSTKPLEEIEETEVLAGSLAGQGRQRGIGTREKGLGARSVESSAVREELGFSTWGLEGYEDPSGGTAVEYIFDPELGDEPPYSVPLWEGSGEVNVYYGEGWDVDAAKAESIRAEIEKLPIGEQYSPDEPEPSKNPYQRGVVEKDPKHWRGRTELFGEDVDRRIDAYDAAQKLYDAAVEAQMRLDKGEDITTAQWKLYGNLKEYGVALDKARAHLEEVAPSGRPYVRGQSTRDFYAIRDEEPPRPGWKPPGELYRGQEANPLKAKYDWLFNPASEPGFPTSMSEGVNYTPFARKEIIENAQDAVHDVDVQIADKVRERTENRKLKDTLQAEIDTLSTGNPLNPFNITKEMFTDPLYQGRRGRAYKGIFQIERLKERDRDLNTEINRLKNEKDYIKYTLRKTYGEFVTAPRTTKPASTPGEQAFEEPAAETGGDEWTTDEEGNWIKKQ